MSLEELLNVQVMSPTRTARSARSTPAVVTVLERSEILASGARDLVDLLRFVPGMDFAFDVEGIVGLGFRGNWAHEGKALLLVDGQELTDLMYLTTQYQFHVPVETIDRIEVVRGPGSVIYGGNAELAVINIVTLDGARLEGGYASLGYGGTTETYGHRQLTLAVGNRLENGPIYSLSAQIGQAHASDRTYEDFTLQRYDTAASDSIASVWLNLGASWSGFAARLIWDDYFLQHRDAFDTIMDHRARNDFLSRYAELKYDWKPLENVTVTPRLNFTRQIPWRATARDTDAVAGLYYDKSVDRYRASLNMSWDPAENLNVVVGLVGTYDHAAILSRPGEGMNALFGDDTTVDYTDVAAFAQALLDTSIADFSAGVRFERHSQAGNSFVPRVVITKGIGRLNFKLLASVAFKNPGIENLSLNPAIAPERTSDYEAEVAWQLTDEMAVRANAFDVTVRDPIVYGYDVALDSEGYHNLQRTGTRGAELEYRLRVPTFDVTLTYAFSTAAGKNTVTEYEVPGHSAVLLGLPQHKATLLARWTPLPWLSVAPSVAVCGPRYGYVARDAEGNPILGHDATSTLANLWLSLHDFGVTGLELGAGVFNALDAKVRIFQAYDAGHAPYPGRSRQFVARVSYTYSFDGAAQTK